MRTHAGGPSSGPSSDPASGHPSDHHRSGLTRTNPQVGRRGGATAYWSDSLRCTCMHAHHPLEDQTVASSATERDQLMLVDLNEHRVLTTRASLRKHSAHTSTAVPAPWIGSPVKDQHSSAVLSADRWVPGLVPREERREGRPGIRAVLRERGAGGVQRRISAVSKQGGSGGRDPGGLRTGVRAVGPAEVAVMGRRLGHDHGSQCSQTRPPPAAPGPPNTRAGQPGG